MTVLARYKVYTRDVAYQRLGEIDDFEQFGAIQRFNAPGTWHLTASGNSSAASLLTITGGIIVERDAGDGWRVVFSGPVTDLTIDENAVEAAGVSDEILLAEYVALPDPSGQPYATEHDIRIGIASTIMHQYVEHNLGALALPARRIPQLDLAPDLGIGSVIPGSARWISMLSLLQTLALDGGGLRFQVLQSDSGSGRLTFSVTMPEDRTGAITISRDRGLGTWKRTQIRPSITYGYVLGQGLGTARQVFEGENAAASTKYGRRIEAAIDRRDTANADELTQSLTTNLLNGGEQNSVDYTTVDTDDFTWGIDYDAGDRVGVVVNGETLDEIVREVQLTLGAESSEPVVKPIISTPGDAADDPAARQINALDRRTSNLERNSDTQLPLYQQVSVGDIKLTTRTTADPGWLLCDGAAVSRTTYHALFGVIGTTYGAGDGSATFNLPDWRGRMPLGVSLTYPLGTTGGTATVSIAHLHDPGTLLGPVHGHGSGTLANPAHPHAAGTLANPNHPHAAGTLANPNHPHAAGTLKVGVHGHGNTLTTPNHSHSGVGLSGPNHNHTATGLSFTGNAVASNGPSTLLNFNEGAGTNHDAGGTTHTHTTTATGTIGGNTANAGTAGVTGSTATDGGGGSLGGSVSNSAGTEAVTGSTATDGGATITGSTATDGGATITGSTATDGATSITGSTANGGNGAVTGQTASAGSASLAILPPFATAVFQIFSGV
jgi:microcystin-dependent protein